MQSLVACIAAVIVLFSLDSDAARNFKGRRVVSAATWEPVCPAANTLAVSRAYNNGFARGIDSNHRYVLDPQLLRPLQARGWIDEGIVFCVPPAAM